MAFSSQIILNKSVLSILLGVKLNNTNAQCIWNLCGLDFNTAYIHIS